MVKSTRAGERSVIRFLALIATSSLSNAMSG
jgi:hypothetical protein